jgi:hypothetical protein
MRLNGDKELGLASWSEAVLAAVRRHVRRTGSTIFSRQGLIDAEIEAIVAARTSLEGWRAGCKQLESGRQAPVWRAVRTSPDG